MIGFCAAPSITTKHASNSLIDQGGGKRRAESIRQYVAKGKQSLVASARLLPQFPLTSPLVVMGKTALNPSGAPLFARHDEGSETAAAEAKRAESHHNYDLQRQLVHGPSYTLGQR